MTNRFQSFRDVKVAVLGDVMLDRYWWGEVTRISPEAPVPVVKLNDSSYAAGGAGNVAANIEGLGATARLIGVVGVDAEADLLRSVLAEKGVDVDGLQSLPERPTTVKTRVLAHGQQVARVDQENDAPLTDGDVDLVIAGLEGRLEGCSALIISDYGKGVITPNLSQRAIKLALEAGIPVLVDPKGRDYSKYAGATLLTPNKREAAEACKLDPYEPDAVTTAGRLLLDQLGVACVLVTQGDEGMTLFPRDEALEHLPTNALEVYDVTGAGDTVIATMAVALGAGASMIEAASLANAAAGVVVGQVGTSIVTTEDLLRAAARPQASAV